MLYKCLPDILLSRVLAPRDDPTTLDFMCSCETYAISVPPMMPEMLT